MINYSSITTLINNNKKSRHVFIPLNTLHQNTCKHIAITFYTYYILRKTHVNDENFKSSNDLIKFETRIKE